MDTEGGEEMTQIVLGKHLVKALLLSHHASMFGFNDFELKDIKVSEDEVTFSVEIKKS